MVLQSGILVHSLYALYDIRENVRKNAHSDGINGIWHRDEIFIMNRNTLQNFSLC